MKPIAFIDVETTGLDPYQDAEIIEICIIKGKEIYHVKVQPLHIENADPIALKVNGYNPTDWAGAIHPKEAAKSAARILNGAMICAHNPNFDMCHLRFLFDVYDVGCWVDYRYIDTVVLAHEHLQCHGLRSLSMDSIRAYLGWEIRKEHNAFDDAKDVQLSLIHI